MNTERVFRLTVCAMGHRIDRAGARRLRSKRFTSRLAKSTDGVLLLLCLAGLGASAGDERLVNGFRLVAAMIQRHVRFGNGAKSGNSQAPAAIRPLRPLH
jgi:hypothetical protein